MVVADSLRDVIVMGCLSTERSKQTAVGASQIGGECPREHAYSTASVKPVNFTDPLRSMVGTGTHAALADVFTRADRGTARWLIEQRVEYRGVPGTCDLFDRRRQQVIDWKTTLLAKIKRIRLTGPPRQYVVQAHIYGAALEAVGEKVSWVSLAYLPVDGSLDDLYVWQQPYDRRVADEAIDRYEATAGSKPSATPANPSRLCPWCAYYRPGSRDLDVACPGDASVPTS
jgi:hypothetical protein